MVSMNSKLNIESKGLVCLYWMPKRHKVPYKQRFVAGLSVFFTKELSIRLTKHLSRVKKDLPKYCETDSRNGINHIWFLN